MEQWGAVAAVVVLAVVGIDQTRAHRWIPVFLNRLRRRPPR